MEKWPIWSRDALQQLWNQLGNLEECKDEGQETCQPIAELGVQGTGGSQEMDGVQERHSDQGLGPE